MSIAIGDIRNNNNNSLSQWSAGNLVILFY